MSLHIFSGEGLFSFKSMETTCKAEDMLSVIQDKFAAIKQRDIDFKGSSNASARMSKREKPAIAAKPKADTIYLNTSQSVTPAQVNSLIATNRPMLQQEAEQNDQYAEPSMLWKSADNSANGDLYDTLP